MDLYCGFGGFLVWVVIFLLDQMVKLWEVFLGELLFFVFFDVFIMVVIMDLVEYYMFCGGSEGFIFQVDFFIWFGQRERSFYLEQDVGKIFKGYRNQVICLLVFIDGSVLFLGFYDEIVCFWDVQSKQCIWMVVFKGLVINVVILLVFVSMLSLDFRFSLLLFYFNKYLLGVEYGDELCYGGFILCLGFYQQGLEFSYLDCMEQLQVVLCSIMEKSVFGGQDQLCVCVMELEDEVCNLCKINWDLFDFFMCFIMWLVK